jgi:hypothetical protein
MDRITKSLMTEYAQSGGILHLDESKQFEHLAAYVTIGDHVGESLNTEDVVVGKGADTGIDAIAIVVNGTFIGDPDMVDELATTNGFVDAHFIFVQAKTSSSFDSAEIGTFGFGVEDFFRESPSLPRNSDVKRCAEIMEVVYKYSGKFKRGNPICTLYYVSTGKWTEDRNVLARTNSIRANLLDTGLFRAIEFRPIDAAGLHKLYHKAQNAVSREFQFPDKVVLGDIPGVTQAFLGVLLASDFLALVQDESGALMKSIFYDNVRDWQDYNAVNSEIRASLQSLEERSRFALMNNGVTIIAKTVMTTANRFHIEDYQIVNGCQTSHVLFDQATSLDSTVFVPLRLIATRDESIVNAIVKATNRQTEVKAEQLIALGEFQKRLEAFFQAFPPEQRLFYERRSRQWNGIAGVEKTRIVTLPNLIRAYASFMMGDPHRTTRSYRTLLNMLGTSIFGPTDQMEPYYIAASALYRLEYYYRNQNLESRYRPARYHILYAARVLLTADDPPRAESRNATKYANTLLESVWDTSRSETIFQAAARAVDEAAEGDFHRDSIRTQAFTERVAEHAARARDTLHL